MRFNNEFTPGTGGTRAARRDTPRINHAAFEFTENKR
jgi:hypothetical protein